MLGLLMSAASIADGQQSTVIQVSRPFYSQVPIRSDELSSEREVHFCGDGHRCDNSNAAKWKQYARFGTKMTMTDRYAPWRNALSLKVELVTGIRLMKRD